MCFAPLSFAQDKKFPIEIVDLSSGPISQKLMKEAKAQIEKSELFRFAKQGEVRLQLRFQAGELIQPRDGDLAIYSLAFTLAHSKAIGDQSTFLRQTVNHCKIDEIESAANGILQQTIMARAALQERILAIIDGKIEDIVHSYSAN
jgi:hypothetical protein